MVRTKKDIERTQFDLFRQICDDAPQGETVAHESPDFLVRSGDCYVGVELTQYFKPPSAGRRPLQEQHALQCRIVRRAHELYEAATGISARVHVLFRTGVAIDRRDVAPIAEQLCAFIAGCDLNPHLRTRHAVHGADQEPKCVTAVYAALCPPNIRSLWQPARAGTVRPLQSAEIQRIVAGKDGKLPQFDKRAVEQWLVIIVVGGAASSCVLTDAAAAHVYRTGFDHLHFCDLLEGQCIALRVAPLNGQGQGSQIAPGT